MSIQKRATGYLVRWRRDGRQYGQMFARKADADAFELEQRRQAQIGAHGVAAPSRRTLDEWLDEWTASESATWAAATRLQRKHSLDKWVRPYIGRVRLADLGARRVREWRSEARGKGATPSVLNHAQGVLSAALGAAMRDGLLPVNPCMGLRKLPVMVERPRALTPVEVESVITRIAAPRDRVLVAVMAYAGLRPGEALALTWDSVTDHLLIIDRSYSYGELKVTKTGTRRTVELVEPLRADLAAYRPARAARGALVAAASDGGYIDLNNWRGRVWKPAVDSAGVDAAPYDLRHTFASLLIHEGRSLPYVTAAMGHASATTTLRHYAHMLDEQRLGTAANMVSEIEKARRGVHDLCTLPQPRRLRQVAPRR